MLDKISFKIMTELCLNGRYSNTKIAQILGISASTVSKKIQTMLQKGIIAIKAMPNPAKIGYHVNVLLALNIDPKEIQNIHNQLTGNPSINLVVSTFGRFDILLLANFRELEMLYTFINKDLYQIKGINNIQIYFISKQKKMYEGMFKENNDTQEVIIDGTDEKLIHKLMQDGRANYADLAEDLGISISSVFKRIDTLIKEDIIQIVGIPNPTKFGYSVDAFVAILCESDKIDNICNHLSNFHEIYMIMRLLNGFNIFLGIRSLNNDSLYQFLTTNINTIDGILNIETFIRGNYLYFSPSVLFPPKL